MKKLLMLALPALLLLLGAANGWTQDPTAQPLAGSANLRPGDRITVNLTGPTAAGGNVVPKLPPVPPVVVSGFGFSLGGTVINDAPHFRANFAGGPGITFRARGPVGTDPTLLILGPDGIWHYMDDVAPANRTARLTFAAPGQYLVFVGVAGKVNQDCQLTIACDPAPCPPPCCPVVCCGCCRSCCPVILAPQPYPLIGILQQQIQDLEQRIEELEQSLQPKD